MKKYILFSIVILLLFVSFANGQSLYNKPYRSATHTYSATVSDPSSLNIVRWYVASDALGNSKATHGIDYTFITSGYNSGADALVGTDVYSVQIQWGATVTFGASYYVFIEVDNQASGCTNKMAVEAVINEGFNALVFNVTGSSTPETVNPAAVGNDVTIETCPSDPVNPVFNGTGHTDIGSSEIVFRVERQFSTNNWQFEFNLSENGAQPFTVESARVVNSSGNQIYNSNLLTDIVSVAGTQNYVLVYVKIRNQQGKTLLMNFDLLTSGSNTKDAITNVVDSNTSDNRRLHTIKPMPVINGFGGL